MRQVSSSARLACALALFLLSTSALAAFQRTFVASTGLDTNQCRLVDPCRSFNAAIAQTLPAGEVVILDTAGYGPMTIDKSLKVIGPSGVYGGISVQGAGAATTGITINAGDNDTVTLRGLDIVGVPTIAPLPLIGINIQNAGTVHIEKSSISNFTQDSSACINAVTPKATNIFINDSFLRECTYGVSVMGTGADDTARVNIVVDNTRIEHLVSNPGIITSGIRLFNAVVGSIRNSVIAFAGDGVNVSNSNPAVSLRFHVFGSQLTRLGNSALKTTGAPGASVHINLENSLVNNTNAALLHGHGQAIFTTNVIANNANSFVDCSGGGATATSFGYGSGNGSNSVYNNSDSVLPPGCSAYITPTQFTGK